MLRLEWVRNGRPAALIATSEKGKGEKLEYELGDLLYEIDPQLETYRPLPDTVIVYSRLEPRVLYRRLLHWPPAYAARVVPLDVHIPAPSEGWLAFILSSRILARCSKLVTRVEARIRGSSRLSKHLQSFASRLLRRERGSSDAGLTLYIECIPGIACGVSLLPKGCDKVRLWWEDPRITTLCASFSC